MTLAIALVSYRFVERPIRHGWGTNRIMLAGVPLTAGVLVVALVVATPASTFEVIPGWAPSARVVPRPSDPAWRRTLAYLDAVHAGSGTATRVLVYGDSIALSLDNGGLTGGTFHATGLVGFGLGFIGCSLLPSNRIVETKVYEPDPRCDKWPALLAETLRAFRPSIVATMLGPWEMFDRQTARGRENAGSKQLTRDLEVQLARMDEIVRKAGARMVILSTPCFTPPQQTAFHHDVIWRDPSRIAWINRVWAQFAAAHRTTVTLEHFAGLLCPDGKAIEYRVKHKYRFDGMHFTLAGDRSVWHWIDLHLVRPSRAATSTSLRSGRSTTTLPR